MNPGESKIVPVLIQVDVKLEMENDGRIKAELVVDYPKSDNVGWSHHVDPEKRILCAIERSLCSIYRNKIPVICDEASH